MCYSVHVVERLSSPLQKLNCTHCKSTDLCTRGYQSPEGVFRKIPWRHSSCQQLKSSMHCSLNRLNGHSTKYKETQRARLAKSIIIATAFMCVSMPCQLIARLMDYVNRYQWFRPQSVTILLPVVIINIWILMGIWPQLTFLHWFLVSLPHRKVLWLNLHNKKTRIYMRNGVVVVFTWINNDSTSRNNMRLKCEIASPAFFLAVFLLNC